MGSEKLADRIRDFALEHYVSPARASGASEISIRAGDLHNEMGLEHRHPAVCGALRIERFHQEHHLELIREEGPRQGASTTFTFRLH